MALTTCGSNSASCGSRKWAKRRYLEICQSPKLARYNALSKSSHSGGTREWRFDDPATSTLWHCWGGDGDVNGGGGHSGDASDGVVGGGASVSNGAARASGDMTQRWSNFRVSHAKTLAMGYDSTRPLRTRYTTTWSGVRATSSAGLRTC